MKDDGGPAFPGEQGHVPEHGWNQTWDSGMSVRDAFALAIATNWGTEFPCNVDEAKDFGRAVYLFAQTLTDEKLRRDKADRDEGKAD